MNKAPIQLTLAAMYVLIDTLRGAIMIHDNGKLFIFTPAERQKLLEEVFSQLNKIGIKIDVEEESKVTPPTITQ